MAGSSGGLTGTVTWYDISRGFGFIMPEHGVDDLFFQQPSIKAEGFRPLNVRATVEFFVSESDDGRPRAVGVTCFDDGHLQMIRRIRSICDRCSHSTLPYKKYVWRVAGPCFYCREEEYSNNTCSVMRSKNSPIANLFKLGLLSSFSPLALALDLVKSGEEECPIGAEERNWAELSRDILLLIFKKVSAVGVISSAQFVCKSWQGISRDPDLWRCIDIRLNDDHFDQTDLEAMAMVAVDRSAGCLDGFYAECFGTDRLMGYIAERSLLNALK